MSIDTSIYNQKPIDTLSGVADAYLTGVKIKAYRQGRARDKIEQGQKDEMFNLKKQALNKEMAYRDNQESRAQSSHDLDFAKRNFDMEHLKKISHDEEKMDEARSVYRAAEIGEDFVKNNDHDGYKSFLDSRIKNIYLNGKNDPYDSLGVLQAIDDGDYEKVNELHKIAKVAGRLLGIDKRDNKDVTYGMTAVRGVDKDGNDAYFRLGSDGSQMAIQGFRPPNKAQDILDEGEAKANTPQGKANLDKTNAQTKKINNELQETERQKQKALAVRTQIMNELDWLLDSANLDNTKANFGKLDAMMPKFSQGAIEARQRIDRLQKLVTSDNLDLLSGIMSDSDIRFLMSISAGQLDKWLSDDTGIQNLRTMRSSMAMPTFNIKTGRMEDF